MASISLNDLTRRASRLLACLLLAWFGVRALPAAEAREYSTCTTWEEVLTAENLRYFPLVRVAEPGTRGKPVYTGFWFYDAMQFDESGRYALAMKVDFQGRDVTPADRGEIGYIDLKDKFKWTKIGETTAWNWQQGCRLQWRPGSSEIIWNDRADDGSHFVTRAYHFKTGSRRTLPRAFYDVSRDGRFALMHDYPRMTHGGTNYVGLAERHADQIAPAELGIEKMDMETGEVKFLISLKRMAEIAFPKGYTGKTNLYFFREGWNPSGTRFIAFLKNSDRTVSTTGWSISADGQDVRFFYDIPSHHTWEDDTTILEGRHFKMYKDNGSGQVAEHLADVGTSDFDPTILPGGAWVLGDTYVTRGYQHLFLFHRPTKLFVPLAKLVSTAPAQGIHRVDLHARTSRDGRTVCIDASHEGAGRQMYIMSIGHILDHPPAR